MTFGKLLLQPLVSYDNNNNNNNIKNINTIITATIKAIMPLKNQKTNTRRNNNKIKIIK